MQCRLRAGAVDRRAHPPGGRPAPEGVRAGRRGSGRFGAGGGYKGSGGVHGGGVSVGNAGSEKLWLTGWRDGHEWTRYYERGVPQAPIEKGPKTDRRGTSI